MKLKTAVEQPLSVSIRFKTVVKILREIDGDEDLANPWDLFTGSHSDRTHRKDERQVAVGLGRGGFCYFWHYCSYRGWDPGISAICLISMNVIATVLVRSAA